MLNKKEVQLLYEYTLKEVQKDLGNGITNDEQLNKYCTFLPKFRGTHAWDEIPKLKNLECCIINLDTSNQPGSHWVAIYKYKNKMYMFDSFDRKISTFRKVEIDKAVTQKPKELDCGQRSIAFLALVKSIGLTDTLKL